MFFCCSQLQLYKKPSYLYCSIAGLLIDNNVLGYNWDYLKQGMVLSKNTNIKNSDTTYGMMFNTNYAASNETRILNQKWATFLSTFFDYNKDNENIMLSAAKRNLNIKVSSTYIFLFLGRKTRSTFLFCPYPHFFSQIHDATRKSQICSEKYPRAAIPKNTKILIPDGYYSMYHCSLSWMYCPNGDPFQQ